MAKNSDYVFLMLQWGLGFWNLRILVPWVCLTLFVCHNLVNLRWFRITTLFLRKDVLLFHSRGNLSIFNQIEMRNWGILWCVCNPWQKQLWFSWWMGALGLGFNGMIRRIPIMCLLYVAMRIRRVPVDCWKILLILFHNGLSREFEV